MPTAQEGRVALPPEVHGGDHPFRCKHGPAYYTVHHAVADEGRTMYAAAGYYAAREVCIPRLAREKKGKLVDAYMDIHAVHGTMPEYMVDVTVRHAPSKHYMPMAGNHDGYAIRQAEKEKRVQYPSTGGCRVDTWAMETYGRISQAMERDMKSLSARAAARDRDRGLLPRHRFRTWLARVSAAIAKCRALAWLGACAFPVTSHENGRRPGAHARHHEAADSAPGPDASQDTGAAGERPGTTAAGDCSSATDEDPHVRGRRMFRRMSAARLALAQKRVRRETAAARRRAQQLADRVRDQIRAKQPTVLEKLGVNVPTRCTAALQSNSEQDVVVGGHTAALQSSGPAPLPVPSEPERTTGAYPSDRAGSGLSAPSAGSVSRIAQIFC